MNMIAGIVVDLVHGPSAYRPLITVEHSLDMIESCVHHPRHCCRVLTNHHHLSLCLNIVARTHCVFVCLVLSK